MFLNLINFPFCTDSIFKGRRAGSITVESIHHRAPVNGILSNNDYVAVLRDDTGFSVVVPYSQLVSAFRAHDIEQVFAALFNEAKSSGSVVGSFGDAAVTKAPSKSATSKTSKSSEAAPSKSAPTEAPVNATKAPPLNSETALDLMTALVKAARNDAAIAQIVKNLSAMI